MALEYDRIQPILNNSQVDNVASQSGSIDQFPALSLDIPDRDIIRNLNQRINDSDAYWNDSQGFDLKNQRAMNTRWHLNRIDEKGLYRHQKEYKENQIFASEESIVSYVTSQIAGPLVIPASSSDRSKLFAGDLEKAINCHSEDVVDIGSMVELAVRNILNKRVAIIKFRFDKHHGSHGEIVAEARDPENIILDKNAALGSNPAFICDVLKKSAEELCTEFPDKEEEILKVLGIQRKTPKQMTREVAVREVWLTHYDKNNEPQEGVVWYFDDLVLDKMRNPNWLYATPGMNLLDYPKKPFIFGNLVNYGTHLIDSTTPLEQAIPIQQYLNRRGRQIMENADHANPLLVISTASGLSKDDGQNLTGDPNQKLFIDTTSGQSVEQLVHHIEAEQLPDYVIQDKQDARLQVGNIMGAPIDFTGAGGDDGDATLGEVMIKKNQAAGRQDMMVRAVTRMLSHYYQYLVQMMIVWYDEAHHFTYDSGDGDFDYITLKRGLIEQGIRVKASKPANPDRSRIEAIVLKLFEKGGISLLDVYKLLQLDNPQQLYDNWAKQKVDPASLARDALDVVDQSEAYIAFYDIMEGKKVDAKENPTKEYILSLRKLMINTDFLDAKVSEQKRFMKYVSETIDTYDKMQQLDEASKIEPGAEALDPMSALPPLGGMQPGMPGAMPPMGAPGTGMPGMAPPPGGMPPMPPAGPGMMPPGPMPPMPGPGMPMPAGPTPSSIFGGLPIAAPGTAPMPAPGNPASLPMV